MNRYFFIKAVLTSARRPPLGLGSFFLEGGRRPEETTLFLLKASKLKEKLQMAIYYLE